jgi:hypothetical protein
LPQTEDIWVRWYLPPYAVFLCTSYISVGCWRFRVPVCTCWKFWSGRWLVLKLTSWVPLRQAQSKFRSGINFLKVLF